MKDKNDKKYLKQRIKVECNCRKEKSMSKIRSQYGVCYCDAYTLYFSLGKIMANGLFQYLSDASRCIVRDDWDLIEKHAKAIQTYSITDSWGKISKDKKEKSEYLKIEREWKQAMKWLTENWNGLWW